MDILVVNDDPTMRLLLGVLLCDLGEVRVAEDALTAEAAVTGRVPDAVVLDLMLPDMDGVQLVRRWRADGPMRHVPVIMLSERTGPEARRASAEAGVDVHVTKPCEPMQLSALVESVVAERRALQDAAR